MLEQILTPKKAIRQQICELKKGISPIQKLSQSNAVFSQIELLPEFKKANNILIYWSLPDELPTQEFINKWCKKKQFLLPAIVENTIVIKKYSSIEPLMIGAYGIMEPNTLNDYIGEIELGIIPGIAFDEHKNRLGRGKGYYDRLLNEKKLLKIGVCFDIQLVTTIEISLHDVKMDKVVSPTQIIS